MKTEMLDAILDLPGGIPSLRGGRKAESPLRFSQGRDFDDADLPLLVAPEVKPSVVPALKRIRNNHHALARLLAEGRRPGECAAILGFAPSRISILQQDPAFKDLLEFYKSQVEVQYLDVHSRLAQLGTTAVEELQERLEEDPEGFSVSQLQNIAEMALDRSVAPAKGGPKGPVGGASGINLVVQFQAPAQAPAEGGLKSFLELSPAKPPEGGE